jgi:hypothetical protein
MYQLGRGHDFRILHFAEIGIEIVHQRLRGVVVFQRYWLRTIRLGYPPTNDAEMRKIVRSVRQIQ